MHRTQAYQKAVVVTAMAGVTDKLIKSITLAKDKDLEYKTIIEEVVADHSKLLIALFSSEAVPFINQLSTEKSELLALLYAVYLSRYVNPSTRKHALRYVPSILCVLV